MLNRILLWDWEYFVVPTSTRFLDPFFKYETLAKRQHFLLEFISKLLVIVQG